MTFNLDIYLSGRVQKLYKIKPADMVKEADTSLGPDWWSVWRCEHLASDKDDKHVFLFTNATCYYSILVFQQGLSLESLLLQFNKELLFHLGNLKAVLPNKLQAYTRMIKGNPRSLTAIMNNLIYHAEFNLFEKKRSYEETEKALNNTPWRGPDYIFPEDEIQKLIKESPITSPRFLN